MKRRKKDVLPSLEYKTRNIGKDQKNKRATKIEEKETLGRVGTRGKGKTEKEQ